MTLKKTSVIDLVKVVQKTVCIVRQYILHMYCLHVLMKEFYKASVFSYLQFQKEVCFCYRKSAVNAYQLLAVCGNRTMLCVAKLSEEMNRKRPPRNQGWVFGTTVEKNPVKTAVITDKNWQ